MTNDQLTAHLAVNYSGQLTLLDTGRSEPMFELKPGDLLELARKLRDDPELQFDFLCNLCGVDTGERLEVVYSIASISRKHRLDFKLVLGYDKPSVESITGIWPAANWYEREMFELYGIDVKNHGDLRPLLLPEDWDEGHPMRKNWDAPDFIRMPEL